MERYQGDELTSVGPVGDRAEVRKVDSVVRIANRDWSDVSVRVWSRNERNVTNGDEPKVTDPH